MGHLATSRDIFGSQNLGGGARVTVISCIEARDAGQHPTMHGTQQEAFRLKC